MVIAQGSEPIATEFLRLYLKHGGSPNARMGVNQDPLVEFAATMENFESYKLLIDHPAPMFANLSGPTRWSESGPLRATDVNPKQSDDIYDDFYQDNALETAALIGSRNGDYKFVDSMRSITARSRTRAISKSPPSCTGCICLRATTRRRDNIARGDLPRSCRRALSRRRTGKRDFGVRSRPWLVRRGLETE